MKVLIWLVAFFCGCFAVIGVITITKIENNTDIVTMSEIPTPTSTLAPTSTATPIPTRKPTPKPTRVPPTPTASASSEQINGYIKKYADQYGVDVNVVRHLALCESGFRPNASNHIYAGLYQFSPTTWQSWRKVLNKDTNVELRFNAEEATQTAVYLLSIGKSSLWPNCIP